jgi:hypothetical protein
VPVDVLLWDFGDTLVDERWMRRSPADRPEWAAGWAEVMADLAGYHVQDDRRVAVDLPALLRPTGRRTPRR